MDLKIIFYGICISIFIINFYYYKSTKHLIKAAFIGAMSGIVTLVPAGLVCYYLVLPFAINYTNIIIAILLGAPGVAITLVYSLFL